MSSKVEFIDVYFKERILSIYALELLKRPTHQSMAKDEFVRFFVDYFDNKSLPIKKGNLSDALDYIVKHTGAENGGYPPTQNGDIRSLFMLFTLMAMQN